MGESGRLIAFEGVEGAGKSTQIQVTAAAQEIAPALTVLLDCPVTIGLRRVRGDDRFHREDEAFHGRVHAAFLRFAHDAPERYRAIDATRPRDEVQAQVLAAVFQCLMSQ